MHNWDPLQWDAMCFECERIISIKKKDQNFHIFTPRLRDMITNQQKVKYGLLCQIQKVMVFAWMCTLQSVNIENSKNFPNLKKFNNLISVEIKVCSCTRIYLKGCNQFPIRRVAPLLSKIWAENVSCWCPKKWFQNKTPSDWFFGISPIISWIWWMHNDERGWRPLSKS